MTNSLEPAPLLPDPTPRPAWSWRLAGPEGDPSAARAAADAEQQSFPSQSDAESWLGEVWRELAEQGVEAATLLEGEREVYGPMSLEA